MTYPEKYFPPLMQLSEDSLVNQFHSLANDKPRTIPDGSGPSSSESFATYDPASSSWRTSQGSLLPEWETYSETWPRSGMTRSGRAYRRPRLVPPISGGGSSLLPTPEASNTKMFAMRSNGRPGKSYWPTPVANDDNKTPEAHMAMKSRMKGGPRKKPTSLQVMVKGVERGLWPTPTTQDARSGRNRSAGRLNLESTHHDGETLLDRVDPANTGGQLNPTWVEWLMGFPLGWTDLED